jgi:hypothetical protein
VLRVIFPLSLLALPAMASAEAPLPSSAAWWEKVTVRLVGDGDAQTCQYQSSRETATKPDCAVVGRGSAMTAAGTGKPAGQSKSAATTIIFERRFTPGPAAPAAPAIQAGDKLLGREVMALAIDVKGNVTGCKVVTSIGDTGLSYGCDDASNETFDAATANAPYRQGYMTIMAYGHSEQVA